MKIKQQILRNKMRIFTFFIFYLFIDLLLGFITLLIVIYHVPTAADELASLSQLQLLYFAFVFGFQILFNLAILIVYIMIYFFLIKTLLFFIWDSLQLLEDRPGTKENLVTDTVINKRLTIKFSERGLKLTKKMTQLFCVFMGMDIVVKIVTIIEPVFFYGLKELHILDQLEINFLEHILVIITCIFAISYLELFIKKQKLDLEILEAIGGLIE